MHPPEVAPTTAIAAPAKSAVEGAWANLVSDAFLPPWPLDANFRLQSTPLGLLEVLPVPGGVPNFPHNSWRFPRKLHGQGFWVYPSWVLDTWWALRGTWCCLPLFPLLWLEWEWLEG